MIKNCTTYTYHFALYLSELEELSHVISLCVFRKPAVRQVEDLARTDGELTEYIHVPAGVVDDSLPTCTEFIALCIVIWFPPLPCRRKIAPEPIGRAGALARLVILEDYVIGDGVFGNRAKHVGGVHQRPVLESGEADVDKTLIDVNWNLGENRHSQALGFENTYIKTTLDQVKGVKFFNRTRIPRWHVH